MFSLVWAVRSTAAQLWATIVDLLFVWHFCFPLFCVRMALLILLIQMSPDLSHNVVEN